MTEAPTKLNLGCGDHPLPGWINADIARFDDKILYLDATQPFPFGSDEVDFIFTEHMIEHLNHVGAVSMLTECHRVLRPGGQLRISTPDFLFLVGLLTNHCDHHNQAYIRWAAQEFYLPTEPFQFSRDAVVNNFMRAWGHKFIWTQNSLLEVAMQIGFFYFRRTLIGQSDVPEFQGLENASRMPAGFLQLETMTFEMEKRK